PSRAAIEQGHDTCTKGAGSRTTRRTLARGKEGRRPSEGGAPRRRPIPRTAPRTPRGVRLLTTMTDADRHRLLFGPYQAPALRPGDRATCLLRGGPVVVTGWTAARIPWPRCRALGVNGGSGLLVEGELARAVRGESATAVCFWWGVSPGTVCHWRRTLGVGRTDPEGSRRLLRAASAAGAAAQRGKPLSPEQVERRRRTARGPNLGGYLRPDPPRWAAGERARRGRDTGAGVARP